MRKICKVLFSRYSISALLIVVEVALAVLLFMAMPTSIYSFAVLSVIFDIISFLHLINKDANPEYKVSWGAVILFLPIGGTILYFLFYTRYISKREGKRIKRAIENIRAIGGKDNHLDELSSEDRLAAGKARAILAEDPLSRIYRGTSAKYFPSGEKYFESLIADIESAEKFIFLEYFIIDEGKLWDKIHSLLKKKAESGVEVRLLFDDIGCMQTLPRNYERALAEEGILAERFARVNPRVSSMHHNRDHRKITVIDGKIAYTGGVNIADEYVNEKSRFGHWKDGGIRLVGGAVGGFLSLFLASWDSYRGKESDYGALISDEVAEMPDGGYYIPFGSGPAPIYQRPVAKNVFLNIINQATDYVYITSPYLIIDYDLTEALCNAAKRGVDTRIITPGIADKKLVKLMTKSSYPYLIKAGVGIYEYEGGFIHEKLIISDDLYAVIGTVNFDYRSLAHHFECGVWMYNTGELPTIKDEYRITLSRSKKISEAGARLNLIEWLFKNLIRIFAPLL